jgi:predicted GTPase
VQNVIIMGAAGRDFHNFNIYFKPNPDYRVVAFTADQIPDIESRVFPRELAGTHYADDIPIYHERQLPDLIRTLRVDLVVFSYSDVSYDNLMHKAATVQARGANFMLLGVQQTMFESSKTVVAVCAVRTGCGKSPTTRKVCAILSQYGKRVVVVRHPMPYGDLRQQIMQRYSSYEDFSRQHCTIEEREEYEPLVEAGMTVYAGVDYEKILRAAEAEADVIVWDGGNNDTPFFRPHLHLVMFDPLRAGHELRYYPGETNMRMADVAIINKIDSATAEQIETVKRHIIACRPEATIVQARSTVQVENGQQIAGKRVLVVEDGPTLTHGEMAYGAGLVAANRFGAKTVVDPRPFAVNGIQDIFVRYPHIGPVLPAMGYTDEQIAALEQTINRTDCDAVLYATPVRLDRILSIRQPTIRARYDYQDHDPPLLEEVLIERLRLKPPVRQGRSED